MTAGALAGILSAPHCALMCGPIALSCNRWTARSAPRYQFGRAISYVLAGFVVGVAGSPVIGALWDSDATQALSWTLAATLLLAAYRLWPRRAREIPNKGLLKIAPSSPRERSLVAKILHKVPKRPELLGAMSLLLPCSALWSALLLAASSGSGLGGSTVMLTFAAMSGTGVLASQLIAKPLRKVSIRHHLFSLILVVAAGLAILRPLGGSHTGAGENATPPPCPLHLGAGG